MLMSNRMVASLRLQPPPWESERVAGMRSCLDQSHRTRWRGNRSRHPRPTRAAPTRMPDPISAYNMARPFFAQNTGFLRLWAPVSTFLPTKERQHSAITLSFAASIIHPFGGQRRGLVRKLTPATGLIQHHVYPTALARLASCASRSLHLGMERPVE